MDDGYVCVVQNGWRLEVPAPSSQQVFGDDQHQARESVDVYGKYELWALDKHNSLVVSVLLRLIFYPREDAPTF